MRTTWMALLVLVPCLAWGGEESRFPAFPCPDGWMACLVGTTAVNPEGFTDKQGMPIPANQRIGWFDLAPTPSFSPFTTLSAYAVAPAADVGVVTPPNELEHVDPVADAHVDVPDKKVAVVEPVVDPLPKLVDTKEPKIVTEKIAKVDPIVDPVKPEKNVIPPQIDPPKVDVAKVDLVNGGEDGKIRPKVVDAAVALVVTCDDPKTLEPSAMLGRLKKEEVACLDQHFTAAAKPTEKDKYSRVLMANAWSAGNKSEWERLVLRHFRDVDQSDADLTYKYAAFLQPKGASRAKEAIRYADLALERRTVWSGDTYTTRVAKLYQIRAVAAQSLWEAAATEYATKASDETKKRVETSQSLTKTYAREWYDYMISAGKDPTLALAVCVSAAGAEAYCKGQG